MADTVDDFMRRFGGDQTVDDLDAAQYHDRFISTHPNDNAFDNQTYHESATEYLGKLPDDRPQRDRAGSAAGAPGTDERITQCAGRWRRRRRWTR
jgi:hypothetical protein